MRFLVLGMALLLWSAPSASAIDNAEAQRLQVELQRLTVRSAWKGVERTYLRMVSLDVELPPSTHLMGAQAARADGELIVCMDRLELAVTTEDQGPQEEQAKLDAANQFEHMRQRYGKVELKVASGRLPALVRFEMPFAPEERDLIVSARDDVRKDREYKGLLPVGVYMIDGERFEVQNTDVWQAFTID